MEMPLFGGNWYWLGFEGLTVLHAGNSVVKYCCEVLVTEN